MVSVNDQVNQLLANGAPPRGAAVSKAESYFPHNAPAEVASVLKWLQAVYDAQTMTDLQNALKRVPEEVEWKLPFIEVC
jgi:hypothetical protein